MLAASSLASKALFDDEEDRVQSLISQIGNDRLVRDIGKQCGGFLVVSVAWRGWMFFKWLPANRTETGIPSPCKSVHLLISHLRIFIFECLSGYPTRAFVALIANLNERHFKFLISSHKPVHFDELFAPFDAQATDG